MSQSSIDDQVVAAPSPHAPARAGRRRPLAGLLSAGLLTYIVLAAFVLVARHWILPDVDAYRPRIEQALGEALQRQVRIDALSADWTGLHPQLSLRGLVLLDESGAPALRLEQVEAALGFSSLLRGELHLHRLDINGPDLRIRRAADGRLFVAGLEVQRDGERGGFMRWLLSQGQINIRGARLEWQDERRPGAPSLQLSDVDARLDNFGRNHRFGLNAHPPRELAQSLELRGDVSLPDIDRPASASGDLFLSLLGADMAVWRHWVDYPVELPQGRGATRIWSRFEGERLTGVRAELALADVKLRLAPDLPMFDLASLSGLISAEQVSSERIVASARQLQLTTKDGLELTPTSLDLRWQAASGGQPAQGDMSANALDLDALTRMSAYLPLSQAVRERLQQHAARGWLRELDGGWTGELSAPDSFRINARLEGVGLSAVGELPGVSGLSGRIEGSDLRGTLQIDAPDLQLSLPAVFPEPDIAFSQFRLRAAWQRNDGATELALESLAFRNAHVQGQARGRYRTGERGGDIDIEARLTDGDPRAVWRYLPHSVGPDTRDWLRTALAAGRVPEATLRLRGHLADFPFDRPGSGVFQVRVKAEEATLDFGHEWPPLTGLRADVLFEGRRMLVTGRDGRILNARVGPTTAEIPDLWAHEEVLVVKGSASGATSEFLRYIDASPVGARIEGFTAGMRAEGNGKLQLGLTIPLRHSRDSRVEGEYSFTGNRLRIDAAMPPLDDAAGRIAFTDSSLTIRGAQASVLGFPMTLDVSTAANGAVNVEARGRASADALRAQIGQSWMDALSGSATWQARIAVRRDASDVVLEADLAQMASALPAPLGKPLGEPLALRVERFAGMDAREMARRGLPSIGADRELLRVSAGRLGAADIVRRQGVVERAAIGLPQMPPLPDAGIALVLSGDTIDLDALSRTFGAAGGAESGAEAPPPGRVRIDARNLKVAGHWLDGVKADAQRHGERWDIDLTSSQARGKLSWLPQGKGQVTARFERLRLDSPEDERAQVSSTDAQDEPDELPALDIEADQFVLDGRQLGRLELRARNERRAWLIDQLVLSVPEGSFVGSGAWGRPTGGPRGGRETRIGFEIRASDAGRLLERLGHAGVLRRGTASLKGTLSWQGSPLSIDYLSLGGAFELKADDGQFSKISPGAGRLLGILSLQSLPRRITLDFRDVFSEGFAFDRVRGNVKVERGIMTTRDLELAGPAAQVKITGSVDVSAETQNLVVNVQPALSDSVSVGALIANPAVGVATYLAQKVLKDPLGQMFAFRYAVTGSWDDPAVSKLGEQPAASSAAPAR
ncbi:YhdP family protein [Methyloversatilis thermotolerans]|uniref:YhdP family protein n=1 Tax=Methyloversatilis thermotolerans TaxID=1346290 RepID=UPI00035DEFDA|nr:YhdP family protein [Methyloversatilis thermotolerans]